MQSMANIRMQTSLETRTWKMPDFPLGTACSRSAARAGASSLLSFASSRNSSATTPVMILIRFPTVSISV